jgi:hypothetical protein
MSDSVPPPDTSNEPVPAPPSDVPDESSAPPPDVPDEPLVRLDDLLNDTTVRLTAEHRDRDRLGLLSSPDPTVVRTRLREWAVAGFPQFTQLMTVDITPPSACSDGVSRHIADYIPFVSGKSLEEHMTSLRAKLPDFCVDYEYTGTVIRILVSRR